MIKAIKIWMVGECHPADYFLVLSTMKQFLKDTKGKVWYALKDKLIKIENISYIEEIDY